MSIYDDVFYVTWLEFAVVIKCGDGRFEVKNSSIYKYVPMCFNLVYLICNIN